MKKGQKKQPKSPTTPVENSVVAILDNVRSSHNVGSMFRTADALGVQKMFLVGYTPTPKDQFGRVNKEIAKVALGAEESVAWESVKTAAGLIKKLKSEKGGKYQIVAVEQHPTAKDYKKFAEKKFGASKNLKNLKKGGASIAPVAFIFGNEVDGISEKTLALCDEIVEIPMAGTKESLNVSVSFGIALARMLDR